MIIVSSTNNNYGFTGLNTTLLNLQRVWETLKLANYWKQRGWVKHGIVDLWDSLIKSLVSGLPYR